MKLNAKLTVVLILVSALSTPVIAGASGPVPAPVSIRVELNPAGSFVARGDVLDVKGDLKKNGEAFSAKNLVLNLGILKTGIALRDKHMLEKYFETGKFPTATLIEASGTGGNFKGQLQVHGKTQPIEGTYSVKGQRWVGTFKTSIAGFGISAPKYMGVGADDSVEVEVDLPIAEKAKP